jgi:hypothetical protein
MTPERWQRIHEIFNSAIELPPAEVEKAQVLYRDGAAGPSECIHQALCGRVMHTLF